MPNTPDAIAASSAAGWTIVARLLHHRTPILTAGICGRGRLWNPAADNTPAGVLVGANRRRAVLSALNPPSRRSALGSDRPGGGRVRVG
jgi:hypothetical protein